MTLLTNNEKKTPFSSMMFIKKFEGSCGFFEKGKKNPLSSITLGQLAQNK